MGISRRKLFIGVVISLSLLLILMGISFTALRWYRTWNVFLDDGPFHGRAAKVIPSGKPEQIFDIYNGMKLLTYDANENELAPIVILKSDDGKILWSIYAEADGMENTQVTKIRFEDHTKYLFKRPRVIGYVDWTYGNEATWWFIDKDGNLEEYWYSW